jgi:hypothetical protein
MSGTERVTLVGSLTADPELPSTPTGLEVANLRIVRRACHLRRGRLMTGHPRYRGCGRMARVPSFTWPWTSCANAVPAALDHRARRACVRSVCGRAREFAHSGSR